MYKIRVLLLVLAVTVLARASASQNTDLSRTRVVASNPRRLIFRTGPWRGCVWPFIVDRQPATKGLYVEDLAGADDRSSLSGYLIDDAKTGGDCKLRGRGLVRRHYREHRNL
jgi:hypothetical protein